MKKKILIGLGVLVLIIVAGLFYANNRNRTLSPPGTAELSAGDLKISIKYSRPSVRGRQIFGTEAQQALQPFGKYWRLGANEPTTITFSKDVTFNGEPVKAGSYTIYAFPGAESFDINLNSEINFWGVSEPDHSTDILKTKVPVTKTQSTVEQYTISMTESDGGISIYLEWADTQLVIPVTAQ